MLVPRSFVTYHVLLTLMTVIESFTSPDFPIAANNQASGKLQITMLASLIRHRPHWLYSASQPPQTSPSPYSEPARCGLWDNRWLPRRGEIHCRLHPVAAPKDLKSRHMRRSAWPWMSCTVSIRPGFVSIRLHGRIARCRCGIRSRLLAHLGLCRVRIR